MLALTMAAFLNPCSARAASLAGDSLNIYYGSPYINSVTNTTGAIGVSNTFSITQGSLSVGTGNQTSNSYWVFSLGGGNIFDWGASSGMLGDMNEMTGGYFNFIVGFFNIMEGQGGGGANLISGAYNHLEDGTSSDWSEATVLFGENSHAEAARKCFLTGDYNDISYAIDSAVLGTGLIIGADVYSRTVVGRYNEGDEEDALFVVGNGETNSTRANAFTVYSNGDAAVSGVLRVQPSGDISMGDFTHVP